MSERIAAIVLAAGMGTRMKSALPKVLHPVAGKPMLEWVLDAVVNINADPIIVVTSPAHKMVRKAACNRAIVAVQNSPLGTGDAVLSTAKELEDWCTYGGTVLVCFGDTPMISYHSLSNLITARKKINNPAVVVLGFEPDDAALYGRLLLASDGTLERIIEVRDANPQVLSIKKCNGGAMAIDASVMFDMLRKIDAQTDNFHLTDLVRIARLSGRCCDVVNCNPVETQGVDCRIALARAEDAMQTKLRALAMDGGVTMNAPDTVFFSHDTKLAQDVTVGPHVVFGLKVVVEKGAQIYAFSHLENTHVSVGASIGPYARLRSGTRIGAAAHVGNFVEVKNAEIESSAKANHLSYIGDARVGNAANIGAGTITCNYDGINKQYTNIGAESFIGSNTVLIAPLMIGDGAVIGAGSTVTTNVNDDDLLVVRGKSKTIPGWGKRLRKGHIINKKTKD
ncbi:UDP-N-acetylglucosamine diphosphorylase/glucosamine-1-phosphate N-acetyltransferase [Candidatus Endolissoclinum faulkneri L5]|uniref:Bifunctional protein GlmU n=1 Tax=Candidatus Endolissoclinum faulkneri L5 TaxID=1401328 RepID=V9TUG3_9PROT|nr:bifunctional UDP-N-acetylglucosamine diphosphorylase/glucosamine-1-phosphate N-acetyltransferase GlmU [Candidatus Endolissoclinum faulkneri]AHC73328.1 UDP-N-acetylglucosamine diphosphorylase/glucosamine-1-phosphate N-acetyltransferase [Candidatus Endolissoclinum faulkneri L5]